MFPAALSFRRRSSDSLPLACQPDPAACFRKHIYGCRCRQTRLASTGIMQLTKNFVKAKQPCAAGYRWFIRDHNGQGEYQQLLDALVAANRIEDACWLLDQFGPIDAIRQVDAVEANAMIFAGELVVRQGIEVDAIVRTGRSIRTQGSIRADIVQAGGDVSAEGGIRCTGDLRAGGDVLAGWGLDVGGKLQCGGQLRAQWDLVVVGEAQVGGNLHVGANLEAQASLVCQQGVKVGGSIAVAGSLKITRGLIAGGGVVIEDYLDSGWGIKAGDDIRAGSAIRAGEGIETPGLLEAGEGHGVYAGLGVRFDAWEVSARVQARQRPAELISGYWVELAEA
ncbi:DUF342 domain-containing protein [Kerstersia similis]